MFVPNVPGRIIPNHALAPKALNARGRVGGFAQSNVFNVSVNATGGTVAQNDQLAQRIGQELRETAAALVTSELRRQTRPGGMLSRR